MSVLCFASLPFMRCFCFVFYSTCVCGEDRFLLFHSRITWPTFSPGWLALVFGWLNVYSTASVESSSVYRIMTVSFLLLVFCRLHDEWEVGPELPFPRRLWNSKLVHIVLPNVHSELQLQRAWRFFCHRHNHHHYLHIWSRYYIHPKIHI